MEKFTIGTISSKGIGIGNVFTIHPYKKIVLHTINQEHVEQEKERLVNARKKVVLQLEALIDHAKDKLGEIHIDLFEAHLTIFTDDDFESDIIEKIEKKLYNSEYAVEEFIEETCADLLGLDDYFRERVADIRDLGRRLIAVLQNREYNNYSNIEENTIIVAHDITPSMTAQIDTSKVCGFLTETGGATSHVSFIAQSLGIPAIVGAKNILQHCNTSDEMILNAIDGVIIISPDEHTKKNHAIKKKDYQKMLDDLLVNVHEKAVTKDGIEITLLANIGGAEDVDGVLKYGGDGVGLFRTEFLFLNEVPPSEEKQFSIYKKVMQSLEDMTLTIRTLDIGGDKEIPFLSLPQESNPFLGYRALRIYADHAKIIKAQIRALLRVSAYGNVNIMIPMVISIAEVTWIKEYIKEIELELIQEGHAVGTYFVGIMVETPSVAIMADVFIKAVDFFSIGTNDLVQYTLAVDRGNEKISSLYQPFHPAIIRLLKQIISAGKQSGKSVSVCGDMGGDEYAVILLIGLGLTKLSMTASQIPIIKNLIKKIDTEKLENDIAKILTYLNVSDVRLHLEKIYNKLH